MRDPAAPPGGSRPSARVGRRLRRRRPAPRRRLGSASCWEPDLHPVAAGVGGAAFPRRRASPRRGTRPPHLLVSWLRASARGFPCYPADPGWEGQEGAWDGGPGRAAGRGAGGSGPAGKLRKGGAAQGFACARGPSGPARTSGR